MMAKHGNLTAVKEDMIRQLVCTWTYLCCLFYSNDGVAPKRQQQQQKQQQKQQQHQLHQQTITTTNGTKKIKIATYE